MYKKVSKYMYINKAKDTVRRVRISKKSLGSDVGEIKKMLEKFLKKVGVSLRSLRVIYMSIIVEQFIRTYL